ncbi:2-oxoacid:acceptor oxidoreductase family protein [Calderihabitans maritimus]|uniref:2-oxoglutarate ferredoxin oxidoreductase subunit gamma n=1 Tax=Calderihabitans maritimus TaxID=1246530 RepID=A0A1Z5HS37_9FIRM|nr:2-oxoacid:acceptor oxidoreductase family protein [Calderihabitans maritimus]GAW92248.1 2-oxoglutarate ferredoxin oxidoreductase subunit gamma [Calderihabitans maritimus]
MRKEIKLAGFGGQGIILMGVLLAQAAGYFEDKEVAQTQSYGPEARGGACRAEVVISDELIDYTKTLNPDIFVAMSQPAFDKYINDINPETAEVFVDKTLVTNIPETIKHLHRIPATKLAEEKCGNKMVANTIMLAALVKQTNLITIEALKSAIVNQLPPKMQDINLKAIDTALDYYKQ